MRGCEQVALHVGGDVVSRTLLLTDGLANVGVTDRFELETHAAELRRRGVATSTFGVGHDFDEALLEAMATAGGGNFYYIEDARQIADFMTSELGRGPRGRRPRRPPGRGPAGRGAARDPGPGARRAPGPGRLDGGARRPRRAPGARGRPAGQLRATGRRASRPTSAIGVARPGRSLRRRAGRAVRWTYADHATNDRQPRTRRGGPARRPALRGPRPQEAVTAQQGRRLPASLGDARRAWRADPRLRRRRPRSSCELARELDGEAADEVAAAMAPALQKSMYSEASYDCRMRSADGQARRRA